MKKKIILIVSAIFSFFVILLLSLIVYYNVEIHSYDKSVRFSDDKNVTTIVIDSGTSSKKIIDELEERELIKNRWVGYIYLKLHPEIVLQAGKYEFNKGMSLIEMIDIMKKGTVVDDSISVTFIEGKRLKTYVKVISENFSFTEEEILNKMSDKEYLQTLIDKYWFLTDDILNDKLYYALEGYLYPDTYHFNKDDSLEVIINKLLQEMGNKLEAYKDTIENSEYTVHELLTMASIVELEGVNSDDRKGVAGVFYNRLNAGWSLGSDVTTYYAEQIEMSERDLYQYEIEDVNDYNTRVAEMAGKLPVGPICSPGKDAILAAFEPDEHEYFYFVSDKNGKTYFSKTYEEHNRTISNLKKNGLWYEYN